MNAPEENGIFERLVAISIQPMAVIRNRRYQYVNPAFTRIFGYSMDDVARGLNMFDLIPEQDRDTRVHDLTALKHSDRQQNVAYSFTAQAKDGTRIPCDATAQLIRNGDDELLLTTFREKHSATALRESERKFRTIVEASPMGMHLYALEPGGKLIFAGANPAADRILKVANSRFIGKSIEEAFPPLAQSDIPERYRQVARTGNAWFTEQIEYAEGDIAGAYEVYAFQTEPDRMAAAFLDITDRKRTEHALRESEEKYRTLIEKSSEGITLINRNGIVYVNSALEDILGASLKELGSDVMALSEKIIHPDYREMWLKNISGRLQGEDLPTRYEMKMINQKRGPVWASVSANPVTYQNEPAILAFISDVTERKQAEKALRESENRYRAIFENAGEGILIADAETRTFRYANPMLARMLGYTERELCGMGVQDIHPPDQRVQALDAFTRQHRNELSIAQDIPCLRKDGQIFYADISAAPAVLDGRECSVGFFRDVTERRTTQAALHASEAYLRSVFKAAPAGIGVVIDRHFAQVNERVCEMTGYAADELLGKTARILYPTQEDYEYVGTEKYRQIRDTGSGTVETHWQRKDGSVIDVLLSSTPIDPADHGKGVAFTALDITERTTMLKKLQASVHEKDILLKEIHHRVKNNLQIISSLLSLQSKYIRDPRDLELFNDSRGRVRSMALIHEQLYKTVDFAEISFADYIGSIATELARAYGTDAQKAAVALDIGDVRIALNQAIPCGLIINELLSNAFKYAFPDTFTGEPRITVTFKRFGTTENTYRLTVADNGVGLPEDIDFEATESLGMHLIKLLVEDQLEGTIEISGAEGTAITITFDTSA